jgi:chromosome partitioning protein
MVLKPFKREYDLIVLDCPPTISILAENIFIAADYLLVPLIPTTLSIRTHRHLLTFLKEKKYTNKNVYGFFSMVDGRKKMHRQMVPAIQREFKGILQSSIPYLSLVEKMGIYREPVPAYAPNSPAADAYRTLWGEIRDRLQI